MTEFPSKYKHAESEAKWRQTWLDQKPFKWDPSQPNENSYAIDTPPPTVSGILHMGHVYSYTQADIVARYARMSGKNVLYPIGFDDNGLPTERLVEKDRKIRGANMEREEFIKICQEVVVDYEQKYRDLFQRLGLSVDWDREYQTISEDSRTVSQMSFLDLFEKDLLVRRMEPILWDPADRTAVAQAEVEDLEREGFLNYISFQLEDGSGAVEIATTRPELLGACGAIIVSPEHPNADNLIGKTAISPLYHVPVKIIADERADPEKGTGAVMCCTFGDQTDIEWWKDHKLPLRVIIDQAGKLTDMPGFGGDDWPSLDIEDAKTTIERLAGMKTKAAKAEMIEILKERNLINKQEKTNQIVPIAERSGFPLEIIVTPQWFIRTLDFKDELLAKGREIEWKPDYMRQRYESWVETLKWDWCISRQRYFGVPIPVWYSKREGEEGKVLLPHKDDLPVNPLTDLPRGYSADEVVGEKDVLDTWATSSVSPQLVTKSISEELSLDWEAHQRLFPMALRPQAHEIIRTWAFYTIVKSLHHQNTVPWKQMAISGWCLAEGGDKMSKSKGNVVDPNKLLDQYGSDVVRYWAGTSRLGHDTALSEAVLKQGKRVVTKLWNASRLVHQAVNDAPITPTTAKADIEAGHISHDIDKWLLARLGALVENCTKQFGDSEYAHVLRATEDFFFKIFCDNYLEIVKQRINEEEDSAAKRSAQYTLYHGLNTILRLFAPFLSHISEELMEIVFPADVADGKSIHAQGEWPSLDAYPAADLQRDQGDAFIDILATARKVKTVAGVSLRLPVDDLQIKGFDKDLIAMIGDNKGDLLSVMKAAKVTLVDAMAEDLPAEPVENRDWIVGLVLGEPDN